MARPIRPKVHTVADNPIVQVNVVPDKDEVDVQNILAEVLARFEFGIGTSFDLQFLDMDSTHVLAMQRFIVVSVVEDIVVSDMNHYQTLTRSIYRRECQPLGDMYFFNEEAEILRYRLDPTPIKEEPDLDLDSLGEIDLDNMNPSSLQAIMKRLTGKGFIVGTTREDMVKAIRANL